MKLTSFEAIAQALNRASVRFIVVGGLREKLLALEQMCDHARATIAWRKAKGLPYFDPFTGELVKT
jgi:hypothetical protein